MHFTAINHQVPKQTLPSPDLGGGRQVSPGRGLGSGLCARSCQHGAKSSLPLELAGEKNVLSSRESRNQCNRFFLMIIEYYIESRKQAANKCFHGCLSE